MSARASQRPLRLALAAVLLALAGALSCQGSAPAPAPDAAASGAAPAAARPAPKPGKDTLVIATQADADSLISVVYQIVSDGVLIDNMNLGLLLSEFDCRLEYPPSIASSYEASEDGTSITFKMREDLTWSDGAPITARDVKFTYDLIADPAVASPRLDYVAQMKPDARPAVLDDFTVRFEFLHPYDRITQLAHCGLTLVPEHALKGYDRKSLRGTDFDKAPVVSGPWMLGRWERGQAITLVPNPAYKGPSPAKLARVVFKVVPEYATRLIELESGSVDMIESIQNMEDVSRLAAALPDIRMHRRGWRFMDYVAWNIQNPLFADKRVRQALTHAINREKLIQDLLTAADGTSYGVTAVSWLTPELCDYRSDAVKPFPFDPARATSMLAEVGWKDTDGDGILDRNGRPFRFKLVTNSGNARRAKAVIIVQANLRAVGIDAQLEQLESNLFFENLRKKDFEAALGGWSAGLFVDPTNLWHSDTPEKKHEFNFCSYSNPKADELIERGLKIPDPAEAAKVWQELQAVIHDDQPYSYLYWRDEVVPIHERFRDVDISVLSYVKDLNEWWVAEDEVKYPQG